MAGTTSDPPPPYSHDLTKEDYLAALCLMSLSRGGDSPLPPPPTHHHLPHKCSVCGKAFRSYQVLGGHMTIHRLHTPNQDKPPASAAAAATSSAAGKAHECSICHRCFPTGQALGGHKRHHYGNGGSANAGVEFVKEIAIDDAEFLGRFLFPTDTPTTQLIT